MLLQILVEEVQSPSDDSMSRGDWISLLSASASIIAIFVGLWQFRLTLKQARTDRQEDANAARQLRLEDANTARQLRLEDALEEREERLEEARKAWLTSVVIQPSLPAINDFFTVTIDTSLKSLKELIKIGEAYPSDSTVLKEARVARMGTVTNLKIDFDHAFVTMVDTQNQHFGQKLRNALNDLEDLVTEQLGRKEYNEVDVITLTQQLYEHKSRFFALLYREVQQESKTFE